MGKCSLNVMKLLPELVTRAKEDHIILLCTVTGQSIKLSVLAELTEKKAVLGAASLLQLLRCSDESIVVVC